MKIAVCIKSVPDTTANINMHPEGTGIDPASVKFVISPYDEYGIEQALLLKDQDASIEVLIFCYGNDKSQEAIKTALAMGADRAIFIKDDQAWHKDGLAIAKILHQAILDEGDVGMVLMGRQAIDTDRGQVAGMLAEKLSWPHVTSVSAFEFKGDSVLATRDVDAGAKEVWNVPSQSVFACTKGINTPRYPSLKGIMAAKKKPLLEKTIGDLNLVDANLSEIQLSNFEKPSQERQKKMWEGATQDNVDALITALREEAKVI